MLHKRNAHSTHRIRELIVQNSQDSDIDLDSCTVQGPVKVTRNCILYKGAITDRQLAIKVFNPQDTSPGLVKKYYRALWEYHANMDPEQGLLVPRPYKAIQEHRILVMDWIASPSLGNLLLRPDFSVGLRENYIRSAAKWLHRFHSTGGIKKVPLDTQPILGKLQSTLQRAKHRKRSLDKNSQLEHIYKIIHNYSSNVEAAKLPHARIHADFTPNNLFCDSNSIWGIDFQASKYAPITEDICRFLAYLSVYRLKFISSKSLIQDYRFDREVFINAYQGTGIQQSLLDWLQLVEVLRRLASIKSQLNSTIPQPLRFTEMHRLEQFALQLSRCFD